MSGKCINYLGAERCQCTNQSGGKGCRYRVKLNTCTCSGEPEILATDKPEEKLYRPELNRFGSGQ